jgi:hypothetical protein
LPPGAHWTHNYYFFYCKRDFFYCKRDFFYWSESLFR